mmetsp:Transcript_125684/g.350110  ORF Transcript_125684/g.350110 Transcript_125684/m.350110 type:complete len:240 (+) Transcript_125684:595-1314(+)
MVRRRTSAMRRWSSPISVRRRARWLSSSASRCSAASSASCARRSAPSSERSSAAGGRTSASCRSRACAISRSRATTPLIDGRPAGLAAQHCRTSSAQSSGMLAGICGNCPEAFKSGNCAGLTSWNGSRFVRSSKKITAKEYTSAFSVNPPTRSSSISGGAQTGLTPCNVDWTMVCSPRIFARPKSHNLAVHTGAHSTFGLLRSRWRTRWLCKYWTPLAMSRPKDNACGRVSGSGKGTPP